MPQPFASDPIHSGRDAAGHRGAQFSGDSLVAMLEYRARVQPEDRAYTFLRDGEIESAALTWGALAEASRTIAAWLQARMARGDRALLLYPPGLDFIGAFFGCLYAGVLAVPVLPPQGGHARRGMGRLASIAADATPACVLTNAALHDQVGREARDGLTDAIAVGTPWVATDRLPGHLAADWRPGPYAHDTIALLQYTSGSTAQPRGVMVTHRNLLHNLHAAFHLGDAGPDGVSVSWLPVTHDMGLIEGVLQPAFSGCPAYLMSPGAFLQRPLRWLRAIATYRATRSGGPNFAYDLAVSRVTEADRAGLDLSAWRAAYNGAETVRHDTMEAFTAAFAGCGFAAAAFRPCYGLAESTLLVSTGRWRRDEAAGSASTSRGSVASAGPPNGRWREPALRFDDGTRSQEPGAMAPQREAPRPDSSARPAGPVSCGSPAFGMRVRIVDPSAGTVCPDAEIGEIQVGGPSVTAGYWNRPAESAATFDDASGEAGDRWVRTGDLGYVHDGELFVTGRLKDVLIVRGVKHFPQDLERTAEEVHRAMRPGSAAAVAVGNGVRGDRIALVAEIDVRHMDGTEPVALVTRLRQAVADAHGVQLEGVALVRPGTVPRTPSGKLQRFLCRDAWTSGTLTPIVEWSVTASGAVRG